MLPSAREVGSKHTLRVEGWAHPRAGLSIHELARRERARGNTVLEVHEGCDCIGAWVDGTPDDHLKVIDATKEVGG